MNYQIIIDGDISAWGYSKQWARQSLAPYKGKHVDIRISSLGGDLNHGLDIRQQLIDHGDVTAYLTGFVASAATVIAMGAKRICMSKYAMFLVHKCSNFIDAWGYYNADEMAKLIESLEFNKRENDKIDVVLAQMYADKCGKQVGDILDVLKRGEWLTAQQALDYGFIDEIIEDANETKADVTDEMRTKLCAYNLPLPAAHTSDESQSAQSILSQILATLRSVFSRKQDAAAVEPQPQQNQSTPTSDMSNTAYAALMAVLAVASLTANADGSVSLTAEQLQQVNDRLQQLESAVADRDRSIAGLNVQIEAMKKLPGAETQEVKEDPSRVMTTAEVDAYINSL